MKLWSKEYSVTHDIVEQIMVGRDRKFDLMLAKFDVLGSLAHTQMLSKVGLLSPAEWASMQTGLLDIQQEIQALFVHAAPCIRISGAAPRYPE